MDVRTVSKEVHLEGGFQEICQMHHIDQTASVHYTCNVAGHFNIRIFYDENTEVAYVVEEEDAPNVEGFLLGQTSSLNRCVPGNKLW